MSNNKFWTPERMTALAVCWQAGETALTIARMLGCTRNAAISKINALGLMGADPQRSSKQAKKKWRDPAYRAAHLAVLHSARSKARLGYVKRCGAAARRVARHRRIIDREAVL